jgi:2-oxo-4-hydroxy-4-carboxy--5-ureidoimidazoline (OHCU) decarboxylase
MSDLEKVLEWCRNAYEGSPQRVLLAHLEDLEAQMAQAREAALEEAAKVAEAGLARCHSVDCECFGTADAIRALKVKP